MNAKTLKMYKQLRAKGYTPHEAKRTAEIKVEFESRDDVRLKIVPDECVSMDDLKGDIFNPVVNSDIPASRLEREEKEFEERVDRMGVYGIVGEYKCPHCGEWKSADSVWGFVGDDWKDSGYDVDVMAMTMEAADKAR